MKNVRLLFNFDDVTMKIDCSLKKLKRYGISKIKGDLNDVNKLYILKIAEYLAEIHSHDVSKMNLPIYNARWVITQVQNDECLKHKDEIIWALEIMEKIEYYNSDSLLSMNNKFLTWNITKQNWINDIQNGHVGSYIWDLAVILNFVSNPIFSDIFLESYIKYKGNKPSISTLYANIFYIQVMDAIVHKTEEDIIESVKRIIDNNVFDTDIISYDTFIKLGIVGYG